MIGGFRRWSAVAVVGLATVATVASVPAVLAAPTVSPVSRQAERVAPAATRAGVFVDTGIRATRLSQVNPRNMAYKASWGLSFPYCNPVLRVRRGTTGDLVRSGTCPPEGLSVGTPVAGLVNGVAVKAVPVSNMRGSLNSQSVYVFVVYRGRVLVSDLILYAFKAVPAVSFRGGRLIVRFGPCDAGGCGPSNETQTFALKRGRLVRTSVQPS